MPAKTKTEKLSITDKANDFIQKNRKLLLFSLIGIIAAIIILIAVFAIRDKMISDSFIQVDDLNRRYQTINEKMNAEGADTASMNEDIGMLLEDLAQFEKRNSGYAAARAYAISANIHESLTNWAEAENAWTSAAKNASKTYFAPVAYFNAAVAAEEQGSSGRAIELYSKALEYGSDFPAAPRAQFSIGRIYETMDDRPAAIAAYQTLTGRWPQDQIWVNLAHSRILVLSGIGGSR